MSTAMTLEAYPKLAKLISAWFHQDFDLEGETVGEVIAAFRAVTPVVEQAALRGEIMRFLAEHMENTDDAFEATFQPGVIPSVLSGSTRAFLIEIHDLLASA
jgi:hypothetical protein